MTLEITEEGHKMARPLHLPEYFEGEDFESLYKTHGQKKYGLRILALCYLQRGKGIKETAKYLLKTETTIRGWVRLYEQGGIERLLTIGSGRGRNSKLQGISEEQIKEEIENLTHSLKGGRLRAIDIKELLEEKFNVDYGISGIYPVLQRLGYAWITARSIHPKADKSLQDSFKK